MSNISPEMTFIPKAYPHEIVSWAEGETLVKRVNAILDNLHKTGLLLRAKLDPHHNERGEGETYCIEIVPFYWLHSGWFVSDQWQIMRAGLVTLFDEMEKIGLVPTLTTKKHGALVEWPGGGCHLHREICFHYSGPLWYKEMENTHRNIVVDYANRPYIRWLFKQWFANGHEALIHEKTPKRDRSVRSVFARSFSPGEIEARFMSTSKSTYPTFEFRMFSMVNSPDELRAIVLFLEKWMGHIPKRAKIEIDDRKLRDMRDLRKARAICRNFIESLGLSWQDYVVFFERNYVNRVKYGQMI